ncbi:MAG: GNAT family protein [Dehalococcoidia bacterium]
MAWIAGTRIVLRAWERDDIRARWEADQTPDATEQRLRDWHGPPRSLEQREQEFEDDQAEPDAASVSLIIEAEGRPVGDVNLFEMDDRNRHGRVGLSIWRGEDRDRGYGSDALRTMARWAFRQMNLHRLELSVDPRNDRAVHVYRKLGFVEEGCRRECHFDDGAYGDELVMGLLRTEFEARESLPEPERRRVPEPERATA